MTLLEDGVRALDDIGLSDVLLPFVLVFTIVFAILQKTKILGDPKNSDQNKAKRVRGFNAMISFALALGVIIPHVTGGYPNGMDVVDIMNKALPNVSVVIVAVIMLLIMLNVLGTGKFAFISKTFIPWVALIAVVYIFLTAANVVILPGWLSFLRDRNTQSLLIMVLVFGLIYKFIVGSNEDDSLKGLEGEARKNKIKELEAKRLAKLYDALDKN
ncbi:MAG: hypothetical protein H6502_03760 [Candidatus Woesearchaeota archaeon]|nr:MAG: hypothetical protein H6502_03760 [Candidatus Woesearchaeota archaeon]